MSKVVFVSVDNPARWSQWHCGNTDRVYYSNFYETDEEVNDFIEQINTDLPDNNLIDKKCRSHKYFIKYVILDYDKNDTEGFQTLCDMMHSYDSYENNFNKKNEEYEDDGL